MTTNFTQPKPSVLHAKANCKGRSSMNGFCLVCASDQANRANRAEKSRTILQHALLSLDRGFSK